MKKTLLALLLAITLVTMSILPASAATGSLGATAALSSDGTSFTVDLIVKNNPGIIALTGKVTYNSKVFRLKSAQNGEIFEDVFMTSQKISDNPYQMIWMDATASEDIETNGVLAKYTFEVLKNAPVGESEIKFEITETVNYAKDSTAKFNGCSFKIKVGGTVSDNAPSNGTGDTPNSQDSVTNDETLNVQKPLTDSTDLEAVSSESQLSDISESSSNTEAEQDSEDLGDGEKNNDRTLITVITIVAVLVLGLGITFTAIYFRKKAGSKKVDE
ncbi:MAG: hypothetical protein J6C29_04420 [Clostridia bacterium]|nr:hypothetical protein [Clostridia bacterium]